MSFFLALDAGGTKTDYVLADETRELARVRTGTIKRMRVDAATACRNLESALAELSAQTGISMTSVTRTCVGTAGETVPLVTDWLRESITARVGGELLILGDVEIALDAAFPGSCRSAGACGHGIECGWPHQCRAADFRWRLGTGAGRPGIGAHHRPGKPAGHLSG